MKFKQVISMMLITLMSVGLLAGCGGKNNEGANTQVKDESAVLESEQTDENKDDQQTAEKRTLNVTMALSEEEWIVMRNSVIPKFEEENNAEVVAIQIEASDVIKQLQAMSGAGKMEIDLLAQDVNNTAPLVYGELVEDLTQYKSIIPEEAIGKLATAGEFDGKTYFLPYRPNVEINFYNENKFNEYGLEAPTDWESLLNVSQVLNEKEGIGRVALKMKMSGDVIEPVEFIRSAGGDPLVLNDEGSIAAYTYLQSLWPHLSENSLKAGFSSTNGFLAKDEVYYAPNWPFGVNIIVKDGGKTEIKANSGLEGPQGKVKTLGGEMLGVPKGAPNEDLAIEFVKYLQSKEVQTILLKENGWPSFRNDVYGDVEDWQKPYFDATQEALAVAEPLPNVPYWSEVNQAINDALKEILIDQKDVKETLDKYAGQIQLAKENFQ